MTLRKSFVYADTRIGYDINFVGTNRRRIAIHVHPDGSVKVDAPHRESVAVIHEGVLKRARWIKGHVDEAYRQRSQARPRSYRSGEAVYYLGRCYQLKVKQGANEDVKLTRGQIRVETASQDLSTIRKHLSVWYRTRASAMFSRRFTEIVDRALWLKVVPEWRMVRMRKQWGSCSPKGVILLNPHLVKAPSICADYVICHEICHLREHNHSPRFYRLLNEIMPTWRPVKARLDRMAELLLNE